MLVLVFNQSFDTQDGLYDVAWSEVHENQVVSGSGDGSIKLWDITLNVNGDPSLKPRSLLISITSLMRLGPAF